MKGFQVYSAEENRLWLAKLRQRISPFVPESKLDKLKRENAKLRQDVEDMCRAIEIANREKTS